MGQRAAREPGSVASAALKGPPVAVAPAGRPEKDWPPLFFRGLYRQLQIEHPGNLLVAHLAGRRTNDLGALFQSALQLIERFLGVDESWSNGGRRSQQCDGETASCHGVFLPERGSRACGRRG